MENSSSGGCETISLQVGEAGTQRPAAALCESAGALEAIRCVFGADPARGAYIVSEVLVGRAHLSSECLYTRTLVPRPYLDVQRYYVVSPEQEGACNINLHYIHLWAQVAETPASS